MVPHLRQDDQGVVNMRNMVSREAETAVGANGAVVRLQQVAKTYQSGAVQVPALQGISLEIPSHRFSVVIGASGSGKTTLLNLIGCIDSASSGSVEGCGQGIAHRRAAAVSDSRPRTSGFVSQ